MHAGLVEIIAILRPMRGGSQSHLVQGRDGSYYVAKFLGNPQGNRTLINEWITAKLFQKFSITTPPLRILHLSEELRDEVELSLSVGNRRIPVQPRLHLGSKCPVDPTSTAIFDFLPRKLLSRVVNLHDFAKALVLDKWLGNIDTRQAIFVRQRARLRNLAFKAYLIDHGMVFAGSQWELFNSTVQLPGTDPHLYRPVNTQHICNETLAQLDSLTSVDLHRSVNGIPDSWFGEHDLAQLHNLLSRTLGQRPFLRPRLFAYLEAIGVQNKQPAQPPAEPSACTALLDVCLDASLSSE